MGAWFTCGAPSTPRARFLDVLVQSKRNKHAALKLMRKLLRKYAVVPDRLVTDDLRSYRAATLDLGIDHLHDRGRWKNNRAENSHQPTRRAQDATFQERGLSPESARTRGSDRSSRSSRRCASRRDRLTACGSRSAVSLCVVTPFRCSDRRRFIAEIDHAMISYVSDLAV